MQNAEFRIKWWICHGRIWGGEGFRGAKIIINVEMCCVLWIKNINFASR